MPKSRVMIPGTAHRLATLAFSGVFSPGEYMAMADAAGEFKVDWYRVPIDRQTLRSLTERSDLKGLLQVVPYLALLALTGAAAMLAWKRLPVAEFIAILFVHGTFFGFMINAFHELSHGTVFKTRFLNAFFLRLISFVSWNHYVRFQTVTQNVRFALGRLKGGSPLYSPPPIPRAAGGSSASRASRWSATRPSSRPRCSAASGRLPSS
jgi:hypothetical protein